MNTTRQPEYGIGGHVHFYYGPTSFNLGHIHRYSGISSRNFGGVDAHAHYLTGTTTFNNRHTHYYQVVTGPGIPAGRGYHVHRYYGITWFNGIRPHTHYYGGITAPAPNDRYYY
ncbi:hypothetical protein JOC37_001942 [Desulfohalotomaculum tongense]|uniref:YmaF family protein n=1 Tax=Desulforadius tongensis TaxID=1216062 RepID=UPI001957CE30|nr:hypothetical protein [Desulforadius tongensis]